MYQLIENTLVMSVNDWCACGLSSRQFYFDSQNGDVTVYRRGINGNTLIDVRSIKRPERIAAIEKAYGPIARGEANALYRVTVSVEARAYFGAYRMSDGSPLEGRTVEQYVNRASLLESLKRGLEEQRGERAKCGKKVKMGEWYAGAMAWYNRQREAYPCAEIGNARVFERVFNAYVQEGLKSIVSGRLGNDNTRKVSVKTEQLLLALWRTNDKPFANRVWELYMEFVAGDKELFDKETGELYRPEEFRYKGRALEISPATVTNYLKAVVNNTAVYADRNGNFDYQNRKRPKHQRKLGQYSLSKISMDDVALSRKTDDGKWVYKYMAVDVLSGYWFRPAYIVGKPTEKTVMEAMRNMFCELMALGLPMPAELEVEHHLMENIGWLGEVFPFVRFCQSATEKRAEHAIRALKYGAAKDAGHTLGRWYAKGEAYRAVRNKVEGDYEVKGNGLTAERLVADDLNDIAAHNGALHPLQKTYGGMTRAGVLAGRANPELKPIEAWRLLRYIGYGTDTSIVNNNRIMVQRESFELKDFGCLERLKPNSQRVTAYWLPEGDGEIASVYMYQGDTYIGEAENMEKWRYNEFACERGEDDIVKMLHQQKRVAKFDKMIKERRAVLPKVGVAAPAALRKACAVAVETIEENGQPENYEGDEFEHIFKGDGGAIDYAKEALESL